MSDQSPLISIPELLDVLDRIDRKDRAALLAIYIELSRGCPPNPVRVRLLRPSLSFALLCMLAIGSALMIFLVNDIIYQ